MEVKSSRIDDDQGAISVATYSGLSSVLRNQYVVDQERGCICNLSGLTGELPDPRVMVI